MRMNELCMVCMIWWCIFCQYSSFLCGMHTQCVCVCVCVSVSACACICVRACVWLNVREYSVKHAERQIEGEEEKAKCPHKKNTFLERVYFNTPWLVTYGSPLIFTFQSTPLPLPPFPHSHHMHTHMHTSTHTHTFTFLVHLSLGSKVLLYCRWRKMVVLLGGRPPWSSVATAQRRRK